MRWMGLLLFGLLAGAPRAETLQVLTTQIPGVIALAADGVTMEGTGIDLMREVGRRAGVDFRFAAYPQARARLLVEQQVDACSPMARLPELGERYKWTATLLPMRLVLLARDGDARRLRSLDEARGLRIGAMRGTMAAARLRARGLAPEESADYFGGLEKLQLGRLDLWAMLDVGVASLARRLGMPQPRVALVLDTLDVALACNRKLDDAVLARLDRAIASMHQDGSINHFDLR
ncbi:transporter substrate-binding domain-containing protein [Chromobacterium subtsugae]|uniref:Transporter substrate-binding domain-containing protein n=1 Tax=Chromobacterium subtsugae TaxID=251747 RepID=A0ABS7FB70_9NEIS|nr:MULTISPECIES: transporter substrate-binding domain-containing protein [Chromobacterium]MBW7566203.1 transporter substrate-binding domain-containing protein [Chromobacterium subtsugae]MBW8287324.1 transporter substrate-binding domain-containing protein [Chromobacterium subtsugae]WSE90484.1 transporter substrate-binding domain-containing protein [Chromobacterium subtsugae]WVH58856.1 transporter substrate-binding domain-containing protein [Chromobacterium subtsugae]